MLDEDILTLVDFERSVVRQAYENVEVAIPETLQALLEDNKSQDIWLWLSPPSRKLLETSNGEALCSFCIGPEGLQLPCPVEITIRKHFHCAGLKCVRSSANGIWEKVAVDYVFGMPRVYLDHFCEVGFYKDPKPPQYRHVVTFEPWVSSNRQPDGKWEVKVLLIPEGCGHCVEEAEMFRANLKRRQFLRCADSSASLKLRSHDDLPQQKGDKFQIRFGPMGECSTLALLALEGGDTMRDVGHGNSDKIEERFNFREGVKELKGRLSFDDRRFVTAELKIIDDGADVGEILLIHHPDQLQHQRRCLVLQSQPFEKETLKLLPMELRYILDFDRDTHVCSAVTLEDIRSEVTRTRPEILHIMGHGEGSSLVLHSAIAPVRAVRVSIDEVCSILLESCEHNRLRCVFLNVCDSNRMAEQILRTGVETVIYWTKTVDAAPCSSALALPSSQSFAPPDASTLPALQDAGQATVSGLAVPSALSSQASLRQDIVESDVSTHECQALQAFSGSSASNAFSGVGAVAPGVEVFDKSALAFAQMFYGICTEKAKQVRAVDYVAAFHQARDLIEREARCEPLSVPTGKIKTRLLAIRRDHTPAILCKDTSRAMLIDEVRTNLNDIDALQT